MATEDRLQLPGWWPTKGTAARKEFAGQEACAECHSPEVQAQQNTPMAHAATRAADSDALRSHGRLTFRLPPYIYEIFRTENDSTYSVSDGGRTISAPLGWSFGLGESGQTYIFQLKGTYYETRLSFYSQPGALNFTPGAPTTPSATLEEALGRKMLYGRETQRCFGCHNTASTASNKFDPSHMIPGVTCEACHGPGARHISAIKAGRIEEGSAALMNPGKLDAIDLVDFCGACHRTFMDVALTQTFGIQNLRFQPYRLEKSQCWEKGRVSCLDCHDPHRSRVRDLAAYDTPCLGCHRSAGSAPTPDHPGKACPVSAGHCVSCHMPKYEVPGMQFKFTDHFIRIVRKGEGYID